MYYSEYGTVWYTNFICRTKTPVHLAGHLGHDEVLRVLIKGYHIRSIYNTVGWSIASIYHLCGI